MKIQKDWGVLISQTGSEVIAISKKTGFLPGLLITNNIRKMPLETLETLVELGVTVKEIPFRPTLQDYLIPELLEKKLITLHGFLRILPPDFFQHFSGSLYNGHPGLITYFPELKGKDPQIRAWEGKYETIGSVVHKVTEGVDEGEVVRFAARANTAQSLDEMYLLLRETSLDSWERFFADNWKFE